MAKEKVFPPFQEAVFHLLLNLKDNELRPLEKMDFEEIVRFMQLVLEKVPSYDNRVAEVMESFCLDFALKCFRCSLLEKRINGLAYIEDVLEQAENRERQSKMGPLDEYSSHMMYQFPKASKWVDIRYFSGYFSS
jgi:hypothetical protein